MTTDLARPPAPPGTATGLRERYLGQGLWRHETLGAALRAATARRPDHPALVADGVRWTHRELDERTDAVAAGLLARTTLRPGDRMMFQSGNVAETVVAYYGAVKAGIVPVCTLPQHGEREIAALAAHTGARGHLVQADFRNRDLTALAAGLRAAVPAVEELVVVRGAAPAGAVTLDDLLDAGSDRAARRALARLEIDPDALVALQLSGGTTGLPKVAPRFHSEYACNARLWATALDLGPDSVVLHPLPIMHNAGIVAALQPTHLVGGTLVLPATADAGEVLGLIAGERVTTLPVVPPAVAIRLLEHPDARRTDLTSVTRFVIGGQRPPSELIDRLEAECGIRALQMFGMAEGLFLYTPPDSPAEVRRGMVGTRICAADEVRVLDIGSEDEVPDGQVGELACRGPYTIAGYLDAEAHNVTAFTSDGFYRTGDLVTRHLVDGVDHYSIDGRIKDVINRGAEKIHAEELEELLVRHPAVRGAAVVAMPDPVLGERVCAYVVPGGDPPTLPEVCAFLLEQGIAKFKLPERLEIVDAFPLTNVGKVSKKDLRVDLLNRIEIENEEVPS
ncbi:AMP-binding protein [Pseudonocardia sp. NPDC046786]|uniref:(2,3-dihydroxybenzoyl)adenylate synthase n=1 Tax=Pseudonocardia sp. NPDC046786 TaxID=3155471 RepID=UPI0033E101F1